MKKRDLIIYRVVTILLTMLMVMGATMYFVQHEMVAEMFLSLGFPTFIIYPLAIAKILGLVAIWTGKSKMLKQWAYAGFTFTFILAISAHLNAGDGEMLAPLVALFLVSLSNFFDRKLASGK